MEVGVRALRNSLSRYLDEVAAGHEVTVTDRGRAIARVIPINGERPIDRLIAQGVISPAPLPRRAAPARVKAKGPVSGLVADQRR